VTSKNAINLCSLNVNGINLKEKRNRVIEWIKAQKSLITHNGVKNLITMYDN
jgi:hypothetical protein